MYTNIYLDIVYTMCIYIYRLVMITVVYLLTLHPYFTL